MEQEEELPGLGRWEQPPPEPQVAQVVLEEGLEQLQLGPVPPEGQGPELEGEPPHVQEEAPPQGAVPQLP